MIYLNDSIFTWLKIATILDDKYIRAGDQLSVPPKPIDSELFIIYRITSLTNESLGGFKDTYDAGLDIISRDMYNFQKARVSIDIYGNDSKVNHSDAMHIGTKIQSHLQNPAVLEYFYANDVGYLYHDALQNLSSIESGQTRSRCHLEAYFQIKTSFSTEVQYISEAPVDFDLQT